MVDFPISALQDLTEHFEDTLTNIYISLIPNNSSNLITLQIWQLDQPKNKDISGNTLGKQNKTN